MGRTVLSPMRLSQTKEINIGQLIIFCEGATEKYYFDYFSEIIEKNKFTDIQVKTETAGGNARTVLNFANAFLQEEQNNRRFATYEKYLAFDCDDPPDIQSVITDSQSGMQKYVLLVTNYLFETWLLMHFEDVDEKLSKRKIYRQLSFYLRREYQKADSGCIREIVQNGELEKAIDNAKALSEAYRAEGKSIFTNIKTMNPYTNLHKLVEQFLVTISK